MPQRSNRDAGLPRQAMQQRLVAGLQSLGHDLQPGQIQMLLDYLVELARWNKAYNLTAITDPLEMVERHIIDSLGVRAFLAGSRIVDSGTGAGLPGVVLAVAEPERHFTLVDSNGKKIRFLKHVRRVLGLSNIEPVQARIEALAAAPAPDDIVARALAPLARLVEWHAAWLAQGARLLAMKGRLEESERSAVPDAYNVRSITLGRAASRGAARSVAIVTRGDST